MTTRAFAGPFRLSRQDRFENGEYRWQTIGAVGNEVVLLAAHTFADEDSYAKYGELYCQ